MNEWVVGLEHLGMGDVARVGGKNASLGEMIANLSGLGVRVPGGFATTAYAFRAFLDHNDLAARIDAELTALDIEDVQALAECGRRIRGWVESAPLPEALREAIAEAYAAMSGADAEGSGAQAGHADEAASGVAVAVRSSATAEDLPDASFAGQQETYLNVCGVNAVLASVTRVFASLYNDRAIAYRVHQGFAHHDVALSAGVQRMVRSDLGASGVLFTLDTESGFRDVVVITSAYGLGETVVQGEVNPDEFVVDKPNLAAGRPAVLRRALGGKVIKMIYADTAGARVATVEVPPAARHRFSLDDAQVEALARMGVTIERHYGRPMDIEWGLDGEDGQLYILQARPETVESRADSATVERFNLNECGDVLVEGRAIGQRIGAGVAKVIEDVAEMARVEPGDVLVTDMTDPDWEPVMKRAAAIVTNRGGRTCHAAIIARELGIPAVVGCGDATERLRDGTRVTVSCAQGDTGYVYAGQLRFSVQRGDVVDLPPLPAKIRLNVGNPGRAFQFARLPNDGVGLARLEFLINNAIGIHPRALLEYGELDWELRAEIDRRIHGYPGPVAFYVDKLVEGIATLAAAFRGKPVVVRLSDFKSNEYANLIGGARYEPDEENPMLGFRGAGRYVADAFRACFELECRAIKRVREDMGFENVEIMIPFVRTVASARAVIEALAANGLRRGERGLRVIMMCEIPANALLADAFLEHFDGFSIGSNDLTQLTLGLDRDSALVASQFDERDPAVKALIGLAIQACRARGKRIGICGQGPSDFPDFAAWLLDQGIDSVSLNPDTVVSTWQRLAAARA